MISRIALTLTLASSLVATAAETEEKCPLGYNTKLVAGLAAVSGLAAIAYGNYSKSSEATAAGIGALTGLGCAAFEQYAQHVLSDKSHKFVPLIAYFSWSGERTARLVNLQYAKISAIPNIYEGPNKYRENIPFHMATGASWASYLAYHGARYADNN